MQTFIQLAMAALFTANKRPRSEARRQRFCAEAFDNFPTDNEVADSILSIPTHFAGGTCTEFCCRSGGNNLNAGTLNGDSTIPGTSASFTYTGGSFATNTYTVVGGNPSTDGVVAGNWVHVSDGTNIGRIARITSVTASTIVLSTSATIGSGTGATQAKVGGAWAGPTGAVSGLAAFPFNFFSATTLTNAAGNTARINFKNDTTYTLSAALTNGVGPLLVQGFSSTYGDMAGRATLSGGGAAISLFSSQTQAITWRDFIFANTGDTGNHNGYVTGSRSDFERCVFHDFGGYAISYNGVYLSCSECEFYNCNESNTASQGAVSVTAAADFKRCTFHGTGGGSNTSHLSLGTAADPVVVSHCVFDSAGQYGIIITGSSMVTNIRNCDFYNSGSHGVFINGAAGLQNIENSNFVKNGGWGINVAQQTYGGTFYNNGFGVGTQANTSGTITYAAGSSVEEIGSVNYPTGVTPWNAPGSGDFTITLAAAKNAGRGAYTSTGGGWSGTAGHPDIGAATHAAGGSGGLLESADMTGGYSA